MDEHETVEELGVELLGVRGYDARGRALHDLPPNARGYVPGGRAWLFNAMRVTCSQMTIGARMSREAFLELAEQTAQTTIG